MCVRRKLGETVATTVSAPSSKVLISCSSSSLFFHLSHHFLFPSFAIASTLSSSAVSSHQRLLQPYLANRLSRPHGVIPDPAEIFHGLILFPGPISPLIWFLPRPPCVLAPSFSFHSIHPSLTPAGFNLAAAFPGWREAGARCLPLQAVT